MSEHTFWPPRGFARFAPLARALRAGPPGDWRVQFRIGLLVSVLTAVIMLVLWGGGLFTGLRLRLSDVYFTPQAASGAVVIVALDDASLAVYGRTPAEWPRSVFARLVERIAGAGARVIGLDILFREATTPAEDAALTTALTAARAGEARTRLVMPIAASGAPLLEAGEAGSTLRYPIAVQPAGQFAAAADYLGWVTGVPDADGTLRRQLSFARTGETEHPVFSVAAFLAWLRIPASAAESVVVREPGGFTIAGATQVPTDAGTLWRPNFFPAASAGAPAFPIFSARDVIDGVIAPDAFADRIVLIGVMNSTGLNDEYTTPIGQRMAGVEIHAHAIETLIRRVPVTETPRTTEGFLLISLAFLVSAVYARLRGPSMIGWWALFVLGYVVAAFTLFSLQREIAPLFYPLVAITLPLPLTLGLQSAWAMREREQAENLLESVVQASGQAMRFESTLATIAGEAARAAGASRIVIGLYEDAGRPLRMVYPPGEATPADRAVLGVLERSRTARQPFGAPGVATAPAVWQGRTIGVIGAVHAGNTLSRGRQTALARLADRTAPLLENVLLYRETAAQRALFETLFQQSPAGIVMLDGRSVVVRASEAAEAAFGHGAVGTPITQVLESAGADREMLVSLRVGLAEKADFRVQGKVGEKTYYLDAAPLDGADTWVLLFSDVTPLAELSELKTRMIRMASHDLKNPLARVMAYAELLLEMDDPASSNWKAFAENIVKGAQMMNTIISDILNLEQLRAGRVALDPIAPDALLAEVIAINQPDIDAKGHTFTAAIVPGLPPIAGDYRQLVQAFSNLVSNAVKYTPNGGRIVLRAHIDEGDDDTLCISVEDNGFGIAEEAQARLFQEFYRVRSRATAHIAGTGLGLSLVKAVIEAHGGRIGVKSQEGAGTTFTVQLPISFTDANHGLPRGTNAVDSA
jgi:signal transduction histidine kinase/CHASE2 domain-containing sensor protein